MLVCVCVGVIEKHGFPQRDPPLIVKWRSLRATPGTSIKHRQATDNLSLSLPFSPLSFSSHPSSPSLIYPLKFKFTFKFKQGSLPWKEQPNVGKAITTHKRKIALLILGGCKQGMHHLNVACMHKISDFFFFLQISSRNYPCCNYNSFCCAGIFCFCLIPSVEVD